MHAHRSERPKRHLPNRYQELCRQFEERRFLLVFDADLIDDI
jgi:hypothetical protein